MNGKYFVMVMVACAWMAAGPYVQAKSKKAHNNSKPSPSDSAKLATQLADSRANLVNASREYKVMLEKLLAFYEDDVRRAAEVLEKRKQLYEMGGIARQTLEESERALADARSKVDETRNKIAKTNDLIAEVEAAKQLAKLGPLPAGAYRVTGALIRYNGPAKWSLANAANVMRFFAAKFGRSLPVSAYGQTAVHDHMGFDHRNAIDVAVHPDSSEGRTLMSYLRSKGIPFIAFRYGMPGSATGAHIHIGPPSLRVIAPRASS